MRPDPSTRRNHRRRPWVTVYDPQGFADAWINPYVTFLAWQGARPTHIQRQARHLGAARCWLDLWNATWATQTLADWGAYYRLDGSAASLRTLRSHPTTLYQFYGFWHWYDPRAMPVQPFPSTQRDRYAWLDRTRIEDADPLPRLFSW
jgi:hypothetical protein